MKHFVYAALAASLLLTMSAFAVPAAAQNRFMDEAREKTRMREEHKAFREAENPEPAKAKPAAAAPAQPDVAAPAQPSAEPAPPTPVPAQPPAQ